MEKIDVEMTLRRRMNIVIDIEYYHQKKKDLVGPIKQVGAFKFDDEYRIVDIFEMTITKYTPLEIVRSLFTEFISDVEQVYVWDKNNDQKAMIDHLDLDLHEIDVLDVQTYFKDVNLASLTTISTALEYDNEGRHNALVDAEYTFEIIKHFNLNLEASRCTLVNFVKLLKTNESNKSDSEPKQKKVSSRKVKKYNLFNPGQMRKANDEFYQINNGGLLDGIVSKIAKNKFAICKDGKFDLPNSLEQLVVDDADIIFSNATKFNKVSKQYPDKLIIIVDEEDIDNDYLALFVSKEVFKKFAEIN